MKVTPKIDLPVELCEAHAGHGKSYVELTISKVEE